MTTNTTAIYYTTDGSDPRLSGGNLNPSATAASFDGDVREPEDFIDAGATWKYLDDGSNQGTAWQQTAYDDSTWASGPAQLGYGESGLGTTVGFIDTDLATGGFQRNATTYYRHTVSIDDPSDFSNFLISIRYDDAAAIYVNGTEVVRTPNLPANAGFDTFATGSTPSESNFYDYDVSSSRFVDGDNIIAVEIHNASAGSSDTRFDLTLSGEIDLTNGNNVTEAIVLNQPTQLKARSYNSSTNEWSALTSTFFSLDSIPANSSNLVVSEIHYRPAQPTTAAELAVSTDRDDFEFIELQNIGSQPIDLSGVSFDNGIDFHFADNTIIEAGGYIVLVKDLDAFSARYGVPAAGVVAGEYSGRLSNDGEQLVLGTTGNVIIQDLTYNDQAPWPILADGQGYSMIYTGSDQTLGTAWSTNALLHGNPGLSDTASSGNYDDWKLANGITDDNSDHDNDGLSAFAEYATGSSPFTPNGATASGNILTVASQQHLGITYQQSLLATDVTFVIQESTDLVTWTDVTSPILVNEVLDNTTQTKQVSQRLSDPFTSDPRRFLRVRMFR